VSDQLVHYDCCSGLTRCTSEEDAEQHDIFFIGHLAVMAPIKVLGKLIRRYDDALIHSDEMCYHVVSR
jgi:hypothetical protein